jgi:pimeloyl-ACP methyl ester carboxylesterase
VVGNSIGGWIAAEMGLVAASRLRAIVIVDGVGIEVPGHPVADFFSLTFSELAARSYYEPDRYRIDPTALAPAAQAVMATNRATLAVYAGTTMADPSLRGRLGSSTLPTLVVWGESDRIADPEYGRAYADAIPTATYVLLTRTGHLPQLETPESLLAAISGFLDGLPVTRTPKASHRSCSRLPTRPASTRPSITTRGKQRF